MDFTLNAKIASLEADLLSAHAHGGMPGFHAQVLKKFAEMNLSAEDLAAVCDALADEAEQTEKVANVGMLSRAVLLAPLLAGPLAAAGSYIMNKFQRSGAWTRFQQQFPQIVQQNPQRAEAVFDLLQDLAPTIANNTLIAGDIMKQLLAMPMLDLGTAGKLIEMYKNKAQGASADSHPGIMGSIGESLGGLQKLPGQASGLDFAMTGKTAAYKPVLNWATPAIKAAGLTDAFTGGGMPMDQANQGFTFQQMEQGNPFVSLDAAVQELLAKEQELAQREEQMAQMQAQMQQAQGTVQNMKAPYQEMTGVNPDTQEPAVNPEENAAAGAAIPPEAGLPPEGAEAGLPPEGAAPGAAPGAELPPEGAAPGAELPPEGAAPGADLPPEGAAPEGAAPGAELPPESTEAELPPEGAAPGAELPPEEPVDGETATYPAEPTEDPQHPIAPLPADGTALADAEHDMPLIEQGAAAGPHTPENIEGTAADEMHDAANKVEEGSPEDAVADKELAATLNAHEQDQAAPVGEGEGTVAAGLDAPKDPLVPAAPAPMAPTPAAPAPQMISFPVTLPPITLHLKVGEAADPIVRARAGAYAETEKLLASLFKA